MAKSLKEIFEGAKTLPLIPGWDRGDAGKLFFVASLDLDGVTYEGLFLRGCAMEHLPDKAVTFQLEHRPAGERDGQLARLDWRPVHNHNNKGNGPAEYRFVVQSETHLHGFDLNILASGDGMRKTNLPIAIPPMKSLENYKEVLDFLAINLNISNMGDLPVPPWGGFLDLL